MSRKTHSTDTPPPTGSNLLADFQVLCQPPELLDALQQSPMAAQFLQRMTPSSVPAVPAPDFHSSLRCLSTHLSKSFEDTLRVFPTTEHTWDYYSLNSKFTDYFNPLQLQSWIPSPPATLPPSPSQLAELSFQSFSSQYPWATFLKGTLPPDPSCGHTLSLVGTTSPSSPLPST